MDDFGGSDDDSMAANNSSAFNCRPVTSGGGFSEHSYGTAIDLNPVQNPYLSGAPWYCRNRDGPTSIGSLCARRHRTGRRGRHRLCRTRLDLGWDMERTC